MLNYPWLKTNDFHPVNCFFCHGKNKTKKKFSLEVNGKKFFIQHCTKDDILFLSPQPGKKYAGSLYNHSSYYTGEDDMYGLNLTDKKKTIAIAKIRITEILEYKPNAKSILEVGCGFGDTLLEAKKKGFKEVAGLEFSKKTVLVCKQKGLKVYSTLPHKKYDVIAMYSLMEHLPNPLKFLKKIKPLLAKGGIIIIRVPEMSVKGPWLSLLDHFWHFTKKSLNKIIEETGLKVIDVFPSGKFEGIQHQGILQSMTAVSRPAVQ